MENKLLILLSILFLLSCGEEINDSNESSDATFYALENIVLNGAQTLVLKERENQTPSFNKIKKQTSSQPLKQSVAERCDELGRLNGVNYSKLETIGKNASVTPCFKNIQFWDSETIFGQYRSDNAINSVWFITDATGGVHHLPSAPKKDYRFKNEKRIKRFGGKPTYLNSERFLVSLDMTTDQEEIIVNSSINRVVILTKDNGEHIIYRDAQGGKVRRPDGGVENIPELELVYFKNSSNDLTYVKSGILKNMIFDATGNILIREAFVTPIASQEMVENPPGVWRRVHPELGTTGGLDTCDKINQLLICDPGYGNPIKGLILADSSQDMKEIDWSQFESGDLITEACVTENFIYVGGDKITKINLDLSGFQHVLTDFQVYALKCLDDDNLIVHGFNNLNNQYETFQLLGGAKTMITENISAIIRN